MLIYLFWEGFIEEIINQAADLYWEMEYDRAVRMYENRT